MLALAPLPVLSGSPLMARYLRLLGCRVGSGTYVGTSMLSVPTLIRIGAGASIGYGVSIRPWSVDNGWVLVAPINVGSGTFVGSGAVLEPGASIGRNAVLAPQSLVVRGQEIPAGENWAGSPSAPADAVDPIVGELAAKPRGPKWTSGQKCAAVGALGLLEIVPLVALIPTLALVWAVLLATNEAMGLLAAVLVGPVFVISICLLVWALHTIVLRRTPVGVHPGRSWLGVRKWCADKLLEMSLTLHQLAVRDPLHGAVAARPRRAGRQGIRGLDGRPRGPRPALARRAELRRGHGHRRRCHVPSRLAVVSPHRGRPSRLRRQRGAAPAGHDDGQRLAAGRRHGAAPGRHRSRDVVAGLAGHEPARPGRTAETSPSG